MLEILLDYLSIKLLKKRKFTTGLLPHLERLEANEMIKIHQTKRTYFGDSKMEGYMIVSWSPV